MDPGAAFLRAKVKTRLGITNADGSPRVRKPTRPRSAGPTLPPCLEEIRQARFLSQGSHLLTSPPASSSTALPAAGADDRAERRHCTSGAQQLSDVSRICETSGPSATRTSPPPSEVSFRRGGCRPKDTEPQELESIAEVLIALTESQGPNACASETKCTSSGRSAALVIDCIDAILMKGAAKDRCCVTDDELAFVGQTLSHVASASTSELQRNQNRIRELLVEAEQLRRRENQKKQEVQGTHEQIGRVLYQPKAKVLELEEALRAVAAEVEMLESRMQESSQACHELRQHVEQTFDSMQTAWAAERMRLETERDMRRARLRDLEEEVPQVQAKVTKLQAQAAAQKRASDVCEYEATTLRGAHLQLDEAETKFSRLTTELLAMRLTQASKKSSKSSKV